VITSTHNAKIQRVRHLQSRPQERRRENAFVVEGVRLVEEALAVGWETQLVLYTANVGERGLAIVSSYEAKNVLVEQVPAHVMSAASDTQAPQGILAVIANQSTAIPENLSFVFIPDGVRDPGNLGTMLRTALAAGVDCVFLPPETVDPYTPKVVRAGMGAHFRLPIHLLGWDEIEVTLSRAKLQAYLAVARAGQVYTQADLRAPLAIIIGGEAEGASTQAQRLAKSSLHIPMPGPVESLNAAVAAALILFEVVRQRN
jgi:TrmH family RNA methyltransferase